MPWTVKKKGSQYCVVKSDSGDQVKCHSSRSDAIDHVKALYANVDEKEKSKDYHPDVYYLNNALSYYERLIEDAQYCIQYAEHEELRTLFSGQIESLTAVMIQLLNYRLDWYSDEEGLKENETVNEDRLVDKLFDKVKGFFSKPTYTPIETIKQADGRTRVLLRVSNIFKDRHGEIITSDAHKAYCSYVEESKDYPEFWLWHTKGSRWGQADLVYFDNGFLTASGLIDEGKEYIVDGLAALSSGLGVSHGFKGLSLQGKGYIDYYKSFEMSPLPLSEAANIWTAVMLAKEFSVGLDAKHREFFKLVGVPDGLIQEWDQSSKDLADILKEAGIEYKDVDNNSNGVNNANSANTDNEPKLGDILTAINKLGERIQGVEEKQKDFEAKLNDPVAAVLEAAVTQGKTIGDPATKANDNAPNSDVVKTLDEWETSGFSEMFIGTGKGA